MKHGFGNYVALYIFLTSILSSGGIANDVGGKLSMVISDGLDRSLGAPKRRVLSVASLGLRL